MSTFFEIGKTYIKLLFGLGGFHSYAQNGEDVVAHALLRSVKQGVYVDVGAYHPVLYSNTFAFYKRGWRGWLLIPM